MGVGLNFASLKWAYLGILITLLALPFALMINPLYILSVIVPYTLWMIFLNKKGVGFIIMCIALCIPELAGADLFSDFISAQSQWCYRSIYVLILVFAFKATFKGNIKVNLGFFLFCVLLQIISLFYGTDEFVSWLYRMLIIPIFIYACRSERITFDELFSCITLIILICGAYALIEYFLRISPYLFIRETSSIYDDKFYRAAGIHGNSLILTGVIISYFALLLIKQKIIGKVNWLFLLFTLLVLLTSGSRTSIVAVLAIFIVYLAYMLKASRLVKFIFPAVLFSIVCYFVAEMYFSDYLDEMFGRFEDGSGHRESGYITTFNILLNNPFGVGFNGVSEAMDRYAKGNLIIGFGTLDNSFLTMMAAYGIFFPLLFYFYFRDVLMSFKKGRRNDMEKIVVFWIIPWVLIGFSFTAVSYLNLTLLYFGTLGYLKSSLDCKKACNYGINCRNKL